MLCNTFPTGRDAELYQSPFICYLALTYYLYILTPAPFAYNVTHASIDQDIK